MLQDGSTRKRMLLQPIYTAQSQFWIESIGSSSGAFSHYYNEFLELPESRLLCYSQSGNITFSQEYFDYDGNIDCYNDGHPMMTDEINLGNDKIIVYPNPTNNIFNIEIESDIIMKCECFIYNSFGQLVKHIPDLYQNEATYIGDLREGIYSIEIITQEKQNYKIKLIKIK